MAHITLYTPDSAMPQEYDDVKVYTIKDGVLSFRTEGSASIPMAKEITTTVPFLISDQAASQKRS